MPPRNLSTKNLLVVVAVALLLIALGVYLYGKQGGLPGGSEQVTSTSQVSTTTSLTPEEEAQLVQNFGLNLQAQINLAQKRKLAGDYKGALQTLEQANKTFPNNAVVLNNFGDLYLNFLKDYPKAEESYLKLVENYPRQLSAYHALVEIYTWTALKSDTKKENILKQGITANPQAFDLMVLLARQYKEVGRTTEARTQYEAAVAAATAAGSTSAAASIQAELDTL